MKKKINNRGFTLIELLAALVILTAIMGIAIPSISSSLERTKEKQNQSRIKVLESAAELFVTDHKNAIFSKLGTTQTSCYIPLGSLDVSEENLKDADGNSIEGVIIFESPNKYTYAKEVEYDASNYLIKYIYTDPETKQDKNVTSVSVIECY